MIFSLLFILVPIGLGIWLLARAVSSVVGGASGEKSISQLTDREFVTSFMMIGALLAGIAAVIELPRALGDDDETITFISQIGLGTVLLLSGYALKDSIGRILMSIGASSLVIASLFVFQNFGDYAALGIVALAFIVLAFLAVWHNRKANDAGGAQ